MQETPEQRRARVKAEAQRRIDAGYIQDDDELDRFMALNGVEPKQGMPEPAKPDATGSWLSRQTRGFMTPEGRAEERERDQNDVKALATNIPFADDAMGLYSMLRHGSNKIMPGPMGPMVIPDAQAFQRGRNRVAEMRKEAEGSMSPLRYGMLASAPTMAAGAAAMVVPGGQPAGEALLSAGLRAGAAGAARRIGAAGAAEGLRRFSQAGSGDEAPTPFTERAGEGLLGAAIGGGMGLAGEGVMTGAGWLAGNAIPQVARLAAKTPVAGPIAKSIMQTGRGPIQAAMRGVSEFVAPSTMTGPATGLVEKGVLSLGGDEGLEMLRGARGALASALEPKDATFLNRAVDANLPGAAGSAPLGRLQERAGAAKDALAQTREQLGLVDKRMAEIPREVGDQAKRITVELGNRAEQKGTAAGAELESEAHDLLTRLRNPATNVGELRKEVKLARSTKADALYGAAEQVAPPQAVPQKLFDLIDTDPELQIAYRDVKRDLLRTKKTQAAAGVPITGTIPPVSVPTYQVTRRGQPAMEPKMDLKLFDEMKKKVNERIGSYLRTGKGVPAARGRDLLLRIKSMEDEFLNMHAPADRDLLLNARADYAKESEVLDAITDGLNLQTFKTPKAKGVPADPDAFVSHIQAKYGDNPEALDAFRAAGAHSIRRVIEKSPDKVAANTVAKLVGSPDARRRTAMIYGDDFVRELEQYQPGQIASEIEARVGPTLARIPKVQAIADAQRERLLNPLAARRSGLAAQMGVRERAAEDIGKLASIPFQSALAGGQAAETLGRVTYPNLTPGGQGLVRNTMGSMVKSELRDMTPPDIMTRLGELKGNPAVARTMGTNFEQVMADINKQGSIRKLSRAARPLLLGRTAGATVEGERSSGERAVKELEALQSPLMPMSGVSDSARIEDAGGASDTSRVYDKNDSRVYDTNRRTIDGKVPTHRLGVTSGRRPGESWEQYEDRALAKRTPADFATDVNRVESSLDSLDSDTRSRIDEFMAAASAAGVKLTPNETKRSTDRQEYLFGEGRNRGVDPVTWTLTSNHIEGKAVDFRAPDEKGYRWLQENAAKYGLHPLGWYDKGHVELPRAKKGQAVASDQPGPRVNKVPMKSSDVAQPWR